MKKLPDLLTELLKADSLWVDLYSIIHEYTEENVTKFIRALEKIRVIDKDSDPSIVDMSIRQIGFDIHQDILEINGGNIRKMFYQLSKFYLINGNPTFPKFIEFLLGRQFEVQNLYTSNYVDFSAVPNGPLITEGGTWFSTSHVNLIVAGADLVEYLSINVGAGDVKYIKKRLDYDSKTESEKLSIDNLIDQLMVRELDPATDPYEIVEAMVDLRLSELFYKFAPINEVIKDIYLGLYARADLYLSMSAFIYPRDYIDLEKPTPLAITVDFPSVVSSGKEYSINARIQWSNLTETTEMVTEFSDSMDWLESKQPVIFGEPGTDLTGNTMLTVNLFGTTATKNVTVVSYSIPLIPDSIEIKGPSRVLSEGSGRYELIGVYGNSRSVIEDAENIEWLLIGSNARLEFSTIFATRLIGDSSVSLQASYTASNGVVLHANKTIALEARLLNPIPVMIRPVFTLVVLDDEGSVLTETNNFTEFLQGNFYRVKADVIYTDGSEIIQAPVMITCKQQSVQLDSAGIFEAVPVYADYDIVFDMSYSDGEEEINLSETVRLKFPRIDLTSIQIQGPDVVIEGKQAVYQAVASWSNGQQSVIPEPMWRSPEQIVAGELIMSIPVDSQGRIQAPILGKNSQAVIVAQTQSFPSGTLVTASKVIEIVNQVRTLLGLNIIVVDSVLEGTYISIKVLALWSDGSQTDILPNSISLYNDDGILAFGDRTSINSMTYTNNNLPHLGSFTETTFEDGETGETCDTLSLKYIPDSSASNKPSGLHTLEVMYEKDGVGVIETRYITLVPKVVKALSVDYELPESLTENTRYFLTASATFEDGSIKEVESNWYITDLEGEVEDLPADISQGRFSLPRIVNVLTGLDEDALMDMVNDGQNLSTIQRNALLNGDRFFAPDENRPVSGQTWPEKLLILFQQYENEVFFRAVLQTRFVDEDEPFVLRLGYFAQEREKTHTVINAPVKPHDLIKSRYIWGPVEIEANSARMYSYSLIVDYDDLGEEYGVSNDWSIELFSDETFNQRREIIRRLVEVDGKEDLLPMEDDGSGMRKTVDELTEEEMLAILPTNSVVDIDEDGYLYPIMNVDARLVISAAYDDGITTFTDTLIVYMKRINTNLLGMNMYLESPAGAITYDFGNLITDEPNSWNFLTADGVIYYQLKVELNRVDSPTPVPPPGIVLWQAEPVTGGVSFDEATGRLFVTAQTDDQHVTLTASYEEEFRETEESTEIFQETVSSRYAVLITAHKALDSINLTGPSFTQDNRVFYPIVNIIRRDNTQADATKVLSWEIVDAPDGVTKEGEYGFNIPRLDTDKQMTLRAVATEGNRQITRDFLFNLLAGFIPEELLVEFNPTGHKDRSTLALTALLKIRNNPVPINITNQVYWILDTQYPGLSIGNKTGILTLPYLNEDLTINIRAVYSSSHLAEPEKSISLIGQSSYPIFWTAGNNVINNTYFATIWSSDLYEHVTSDRGGRFSISPNSNEYLYFAHPKSFGNAALAIVPSTTEQVDWGNLQAPVEVTRTYMDGTTEQWYVYRSLNRGFGESEFSITYTR